MKKTYAVLGGGGSFGLHTSKYLLDHADPAKVIAVGRNLPKYECFTLGIGDGDPRYSYHAYHVNYELDLLMEVLDREKPQVIVNFAAQGEGATSLKHSWRYFETNCVALAKLAEALQSRSYLERFIHIGTSELYGSVEHAATEDEPIKPTSPYAASKAAFDMHLISIHRFLKFPMNIIRPSNAYGPGQQLHRVIPKTVLCGVDRTQAAAARRRAGRKVLHPQSRPRPRHSSGGGEGAARHGLQCRTEGADLDPPGGRAGGGSDEDAVRADLRSDRRPPAPGLRAIGSTAPPSSATSAGSRRSAGRRAWARWWNGGANICRSSRACRPIS